MNVFQSLSNLFRTSQSNEDISSGEIKWTNPLSKNGFLDSIEGIQTLNDITNHCVKIRPNHGCIGKRKVLEKITETKNIDGVDKDWNYFRLSPFEWITYKEFQDEYSKFGSALMHIGFKEKDNFSIYEDTCFEWNVAAQGAFRQNMTVLTVYSNLGYKALEHSLNLGDVKGILVNGQNLGVISKIIDNIKSLKHIIVVGDVNQKYCDILEKKGLNIYTYESFIKLGEENPAEENPPIHSDIALIMFTSGTTGLPKGVVLTHRNVIASIAATLNILIDDVNIDEKTDRYLSFLPLAHILAFVVHYAALYMGVPVGYGHVRTLLEGNLKDCKSDLKELQPTLFVGVPAIFERMKSGIEKKLRHLGMIKRNIFQTSFSLKKFFSYYGIPLPFVDRFVFDSIKSEMGGKIRLIISGGAALSPEINSFIRTCCSTTILQGYGLTETCGPTCVQSFYSTSLTNVGVPITCVELKLVDIPDKGYSIHDKPYPRGEIYIRGTNVSSQYYKNEEETKKAFIDGWFRTGDIGLKYPDGTLMIIDRLKNLVKPPHGEYIALENLETVYKSNEWISQLLVYVDSEHDQCIALIVPIKDKVLEYAEKHGLNPNGSYKDLCNQDNIRNEVKKALNETARASQLKSIEMIRSVVLLPEEWTTENDMMTAGHKVKRNVVIEKHKESIQRMYKELKG